MQVIAEDLHCTAVRVSGGDPERLSIAARHAAAVGLEMWFSPHPCELTTAQMQPYYLGCAERAEQLRRDGATVVMVAGCELSLFTRGYLPGDTFSARVQTLTGSAEQGPTTRPSLERITAWATCATRATRSSRSQSSRPASLMPWSSPRAWSWPDGYRPG